MKRVYLFQKLNDSSSLIVYCKRNQYLSVTSKLAEENSDWIHTATMTLLQYRYKLQRNELPNPTFFVNLSQS